LRRSCFRGWRAEHSIQRRYITWMSNNSRNISRKRR
jgi:hypothetical protein